MSCRCGRNTDTEHLCHGDAYTCPNEGIERLLTYPVGLAGVQFKLGGYQTWACDECWVAHKAQLELQSMVLQIVRDEKVVEFNGDAYFTYEDDLDGWMLHVNGVIHMGYYAEDPEGGGMWVPALADIDMSVRSEAGKAAIKAIYVEKFGVDANPLSKEMTGEIKNPDLGVRDD